MAFHIHPLERFGKKVLWPHKVDEVGYFSVSPKREYLNNDSQRKLLLTTKEQPSLAIDIKKEFKKFKKRTESENNEEFHLLLKWISHNLANIKQVNNISADGANSRPHFVGWRTIFSKFLTTPYEERDGWIMGITLYNKIYYLYDLTERTPKKGNKISEDDACEIFRHYLKTYDPKKKEYPPDPIDPNPLFCAVSQINFDSHKILVGDAVDCCNTPSSSDSMQKYVDVRINKDISSPKEYWFFKRYRILKWWSMCYIMGISKVIWGHLTDRDTIIKCSVNTLEDILQVCEPDKWNPSVCLNFCNGLLQFITENVTKDDPRIIYLLEFSLGNDITCREMNLEEEEYSGLPEWYFQDTQESNQSSP